ncbi:MAG: TIGR03768 family metallophosphoesterase [Victivallales bacterium]
MKKLLAGMMVMALGICFCTGTLLAVDKGDQTITFNALPGKVYGNANFAPGATASSGLTVTYTSSNLNVATIVSGKIHITGVGASTITAQQSGNASWNAAPTVPQALTVGKGTPVITWANPADIVYGKPLSTTQLNARANVPGSFAYDPVAGIILSANVVPQDLDVTFTPTDTARYTTAQKTVSLTVKQATPTLTIAGLRQKYDGDPHAVSVTTVPAGLNVDVTYNGDSGAPANIGLYAVVATVNDPNAKVAAKSAVLMISKGAQTITFPPLPIKVFGDADFSPGAAASSGLTVAYASSNLNVATILGGMIHIVGKGSAVITATQPGNATWNAAVAIRQTVKVTTNNQTITFNALPDKVYGTANFAPGATASSGLVVTYASSNLNVATIVSGKIHITGAGTSIITAEQAGNATWNVAPQVTQTLTVAANAPTYPIAADVYTTLDKTLVPMGAPDNPFLLPCQVSEYEENGYGVLNPDGGPAPFLLTNMIDMTTGVSVRDPLAATLLTFFSISDTHLTDKESPAQAIYYGYEAGPLSNISAYSAIILYTTHVLDAAIQTVNVLNKRTPFDFGIDLGDAVNNNQYNELRWFIDVFDGQRITPSSGAHLGTKTIDYQKPYQAAGLDKSIKWYQAMGNHDPFWTGCLLANDYIKETIVGSSILNLGSSSATYAGLSLRGFYMGVVDGTTKYGEIIDVGPVEYYLTPPKVAPDPDRRSLSIRDWMGEFQKSTTLPAGHGVTNELINDGLLCYTFYPRADIPLKVIVLDDIDKGGSANGTLDYQRYDWLVKELDEGEADGELMIVCAHIPVRPYAPPPTWSAPDTPSYYTLFATYSMISEEALLQKLWTYQNLIMWVSGHVHRNAITNQPPGPGGIFPTYTGDLTHGFWEVETPSLRDFPQQFRHFEIVRNSDNNISIFALDIDPAARAPAEVGASAPAWTSRSYALAGHQIYQVPMEQGPNVDPDTGVYNAELVKQLSPAMQAKLAAILPNVSSFQINGNATSTTSQTVTLNNTLAGTTPTDYMASEDSDFDGAAWLPYSNAPAFVMSSGAGTKTVYLKVKDGSGTESASVGDSIALK